MELTLKIVDADGFVRASSTGRDETFLVYRQDYRESDCVVVEASETRTSLSRFGQRNPLRFGLHQGKRLLARRAFRR